MAAGRLRKGGDIREADWCCVTRKEAGSCSEHGPAGESASVLVEQG
jgi:hypothetical protein